jgi:hypothetical protein
MGRAFRIIKRTSHLTVFVGQRPEKTTVVTRVGETDDGVIEPKKTVGSSVASGGRKKATVKKAAARKTTGAKKTTKKNVAKKATKKSDD